MLSEGELRLSEARIDNLEHVNSLPTGVTELPKHVNDLPGRVTDLSKHMTDLPECALAATCLLECVMSLPNNLEVLSTSPVGLVWHEKEGSVILVRDS